MLMEKGTPHSSLSVVKSMLAAGKVRSTMTALAGGAALAAADSLGGRPDSIKPV